MPDTHKRPSIAEYKPDVSLGNILTLVGMIAMVIIWGLRLEGRVDAQYQIMQMEHQNNEVRFSHMDARMNRQRIDFEKSLLAIGRSLERIENKLDGKADKRP